LREIMKEEDLTQIFYIRGRFVDENGSKVEPRPVGNMEYIKVKRCRGSSKEIASKVLLCLQKKDRNYKKVNAFLEGNQGKFWEMPTKNSTEIESNFTNFMEYRAYNFYEI